jgi:hypothetical protein
MSAIICSASSRRFGAFSASEQLRFFLLDLPEEFILIGVLSDSVSWRRFCRDRGYFGLEAGLAELLGVNPIVQVDYRGTTLRRLWLLAFSNHRDNF